MFLISQINNILFVNLDEQDPARFFYNDVQVLNILLLFLELIFKN
jgi:hypothetical protein